jgi:flagellar motor switch/type III secretory pathway protein FliN
LINRSEGGAVVAQLTGAIRHWSDQYVAVSPQVGCVLVSSEELPGRMRAPREWMIGTDASGPMLAIGLPDDWRHQLMALMLPGNSVVDPATATGGLARELCSSVLGNLGQRVQEAFAGAQRVTAELSWDLAPAPPDARSDDGFVMVRCQVGPDLDLSVALWPECVRASLPGVVARRPGEATVEPLAKALQGEVVVLCAMVGNAELAVEELTTLSVGDVLRLDKKISEPLQLYVDGGGPVCAARLGSHLGRRALQLT